jgi:transposase
MPASDCLVTVGVDSHGDVHVAAAVDQLGRLVATTTLPTTTRGYRQMLSWARGLGQVQRFGVEGTGAFAAGLLRFLQANGQVVLEVDRPDRSTRRRRGKSDPVDAEAAARAVLSRSALGTPKARNGKVEMIRALRVARRSAIKARTQAANQLHDLVVAAPEPVRAQLRGLAIEALVKRAAGFRPGTLSTPVAATKLAMRELARRWLTLDAEIGRLDTELDRLVGQTAPQLTALVGVGTDVAGALLVAAGDNPQRLGSEASFARLCGVAPLEASSGKTVRHRLNRGGDRQANNALWRIVLVRLAWDPRTRDYLARRTKQGKSKKEIMRCLKRYVARKVFALLKDPVPPPTPPLHIQERRDAVPSLGQAAAASNP